MDTIAVTGPEYDKARDVFTHETPLGLRCLYAPVEEGELSRFIRENGAHHAIVGTVPYRDELYEALGEGSVLVRFGVGHDSIDKAKVESRGILCANTPDVLEDSVAEHAMLLMLAASRNLCEMASGMRGGRWDVSMGREVRGKRLAIIGCGRIGGRVALIASRGFGMEVVTYDTRALCIDEVNEKYGVREVMPSFRAAVEEAAFVSLHIPAKLENNGYINAQTLGFMRKDAWLVNTSRGSIIDEGALFDALSQEQLAGAALDVFQVEPYLPQDTHKDLRSLSRVLLSPHVGSSTREACARVARRALRNIELARKGDYEAMDLVSATRAEQ